jgi:hypothetical protein
VAGRCVISFPLCFPHLTHKRIGNVPSFQRPENAGEADFEWSDMFGLAFRTKGCFGVSLGTLALLIGNFAYPRLN